MTIHPITFDATSVRAIIDPRAPGYPKTMTRRVLTEAEARRGMGLPKTHRIDLSHARFDRGFPDADGVHRYGYLHVPYAHPDDMWHPDPLDNAHARCYAKWAPGDVLWVKEAWNLADPDGDDAMPDDVYGPRAPYNGLAGTRPIQWRCVYRAGGRDSHPKFGKAIWRSPRFMPLWACRVFLRVEAIRPERVQDITRGDAMEEGCPFANMAKGPDPREWFHDRWDSLNAKRGHPWAKNDWVWATTHSVLSATGIDGLPDDVAAMVRERVERNARARRAR